MDLRLRHACPRELIAIGGRQVEAPPGKPSIVGHALQRSADLPVSVICADMDGFKAVNDNFGHAAGDVVMKGYLEAVRESVGMFGDAYRGSGRRKTKAAPLYVALLGPPLLGERFQRRDIGLLSAVGAGLALCMAGGAESTVTAPDPVRGEEPSRWALVGGAMILVATAEQAFYGASSPVGSRFQKRKGSVRLQHVLLHTFFA